MSEKIERALEKEQSLVQEILNEIRSKALASKVLMQEDQKTIDALYKSLGEEKTKGKNKDQIIQELVMRGWKNELVIEALNIWKQVMDEYKEKIEKYEKSPEARRIAAHINARFMLYGILFIAGGTIASVVLKDIGVIWVGAFVVGIPLFVIGLFRYLWHKLRLTVGR